MKRIFTPLLVCCSLWSWGQDLPGLIVNEVGNLTGTTCCAGAGREFFELLVLGPASGSTANVDLSGWIIDDNNGEFEGLGLSQTGHANGHLRFASTGWTSVPPGSLIVIYNDGGSCTSSIYSVTDDPTDSNGDGVYILPVSNALIEECPNYPCNGSVCGGGAPLSSSYEVGTGNCTYSNAGSCQWASVSLRNGGDAVQVRKPDATFYHGYSFGDVNTVFPTFPNGNSSFNAGASIDDIEYDACENATTSAAHSEAMLFTPGAANNSDNNAIIEAIKNGTADYNQIIGTGSPTNCTQILPVDLVYFNGKRVGEQVWLEWATAWEEDNEGFAIERSQDGTDFEEIAFVRGAGTYDDFLAYSCKDVTAPTGVNYYRLKQIDFDGDFEYSALLTVAIPQKGEMRILPSLVQSDLTVEFEKAVEETVTIQVLNLLGQLVAQEQMTPGAYDLTLAMDYLSPGQYVLQAAYRGKVITQTFVKQ
ncbi:MAG: T9SS type A sorting domain-containing protein [Bacteroidota bacterium]